MNALGVITGFLYNHSTPDLYGHGKHGTIGYIITLLVSVWVLLEFVDTHSRRRCYKRNLAGTDFPLQDEASGWHSENLIADITAEHNSETDSGDEEKQGFLSGTIVDRFLKEKFTRFEGMIRAIRLVHLVLGRAALVLGFLGITSGVVIYTGIFVGHGYALGWFTANPVPSMANTSSTA